MPAKAVTKNPTNPKSAEPLVGVPRYGQRNNKGLYAVVKNPEKRAKKVVKPAKQQVVKTFGKKNPKQVVVEEKFAKYYPVVRSFATKTKASNQTKLRKSITNGTVVILLAGRFAGKRVVVLKQLPSGLLLVTGPYKVNGVPLRRVDQRYVIATSTKVDVSSVQIPEQVTDKLWAKDKKSVKDVKKDDEKKFFEKKQQNPLPAEFVQYQQTVDEALIKVIGGTEYLKEFLGTRFSLSNGQYPHEMKF
ncbi:ribosomal protein L6 [Acrasis kona]|uniref:60S ribosomal protein L6 n=1 Tax=Acrasis kona TaxID=1008807 RepID=A0AAW2Z1B0_9EUKA